MVSDILIASVLLVIDSKITEAFTTSDSGSLNCALINKFDPGVTSVAVLFRTNTGGVVSIVKTSKSIKLVTVTPLTIIDIGPDFAPAGTVVVKTVELDASTTAGIPLKVTVLAVSSELKFDPVIFITVPTTPLTGLKLVMVGEGITVKSRPLETVTPFKVNAIFPVVAPLGTIVVRLVEVDVVTRDVTPLNVITLYVGVKSKLVPVMVTIAPTAPLAGLKVKIDGVGNTLKLVALVIVTPLVVREIGPVLAPTGTVVERLLVVAFVTTVEIPLNATLLFAGIALKFVPVIVIEVPGAPSVGLKLVNVGEGSMLKFDELVMVTPLTVIVIGPVTAPEGTVVVILVVVEDVTTADVLLNFTIRSFGVVLKLVPEMVTLAPTAPPVGVNPVKVGVGNMVKSEMLVIVTPLTVIDIKPVVLPAGIVVVILVFVEAFTMAVVLLNLTI